MAAPAAPGAPERPTRVFEPKGAFARAGPLNFGSDADESMHSGSDAEPMEYEPAALCTPPPKKPLVCPGAPKRPKRGAE